MQKYLQSSLSLCIALSFSAASTLALATPSMDIDADHDGLIDISTLEQLDWVRNNPNGTSLIDHDGNVLTTGCPETGCFGYELVNDIDFDTNGDGVLNNQDWVFDYEGNGSQQGWKPIPLLSSTFEGNGYSIDNIFISRPDENGVGLITLLTNGEANKSIAVQNLTLSLSSFGISGGSRVGGVAGTVSVLEDGEVMLADVKVEGSIEGQYDVGGLIGRVSNEYADEQRALGLVELRLHRNAYRGSIKAIEYVGGLVGGMRDKGGLSGYGVDFTKNAVSVSIDAVENIGGLLGYSRTYLAQDMIFTNNYGDVNISAIDVAGGLYGYIENIGGGRWEVKKDTVVGVIQGHDTIGGLIAHGHSQLGTEALFEDVKVDAFVFALSIAGGLAANLSAYETGNIVVRDSYAQGNVGAEAIAGGLIGRLSNEGYWGTNVLVDGSFAAARVSGDLMIGGLIGLIPDAGSNEPEPSVTIRNSFSMGSVVGSDQGFESAGGLIGKFESPLYFPSEGIVENSYSVSKMELGELPTYSTVGSFAGEIPASVINRDRNYVAADVNSISSVGSASGASSSLISSALLSEMACPELPNNTSCSSETLFKGWNRFIWNFGDSTQLPGLKIRGKIFRPDLVTGELSVEY
ncbi:hypothetical protein [Marinibactrum halimedae]|uniref:GLUG domain-containing protein n=1 Tax=Marinibactrum halimedae TaxID=1444977 RepID=A0AA37T987_9GAMM|nr:hypothetical protein [Marinibactrum halimedae]MCD9460563.1 hypothetical protein [Marinibactrum halimedae]GLS27193.1 hypothetical protein GCM10007877_29120 [Marinibactrum halimedae]